MKNATDSIAVIIVAGGSGARMGARLPKQFLPVDERFTDDASVVEAAGQPVYLCEGSYENIKITTPVDMLTAEALLAQRQRTSATAGE